MKKSSKFGWGVLLVFALLTGGCRTVDQNASGNQKFERLFSWGSPTSEAAAKRYAAAGVTDIVVHNRKQFDLAVKYGMTPYWKCFTPAGPHRQVMTPEETRHHDYINGKDLDRKLSRAERMKIIHRRRIEKQHRYGGEQIVEIDTLNNQNVPCFNCDEGLALSRKKLDKMMADAPDGAAGMFLDYFGYTNHQGCYCEKCLAKYRKYLAENKLKDTPENRTVFYRGKLVDYYNKIIDYIKSKHPNYKIAIHVYPDFRNDHLYGNRTKADYCGQTVSWYFKFDERKIREYTQFVVKRAKDHYPNAEGLPFIGLSTDKNHSLGYKTPAEVEHDMRTILAAGGRTVMVCNGNAIIEPGYFEVFRKYCGQK